MASTSETVSAAPPHGHTSHSASMLEEELQSMKKVSLKSPHCDLVNFLAAVQSAQIDFMPLSWSSSVKVGRGGYAVINESFVHATHSYAYRRARNRGGEHDFKSDMIELAILSHRPIEMHDNIVTLEGICWEISPKERRMAPVFVYERMPHGDLCKFRDAEEFHALSLDEKLGLCVDIGNALLTLHSCKIIHGDIKPDNILITRDRGNRRLSIPARFVAKVADFGSSQVCWKDQVKPFHFPGTPGWTAPEHNHQGCGKEQGLAMDVYRFCLVCLWLLLPDRNGQSAQRDIDKIRAAEDPCQKAVEMVESLGYDGTVKHRLRRLFRSSLANDPSNRTLSLKQILALLDPKWKEIKKEKYSTPLQLTKQHSGFQVSSSLCPLLSTNYLVRKLIFESLKEKTLSDGCTKCRRKTALQTAFCYFVGFGTERDPEMAVQIVQDRRVNKGHEHLEDETEQVSTLYPYKNLAFLEMLGGFSAEADWAIKYRVADHYVLEDVINEYAREARDMAASFPDLTELVLAPKMTLAVLLHGTGDPGRAVPLYREILAGLQSSRSGGRYREGHIQESRVLKCLADALRLTGHLTEAQEVATEALALNPVADNEICLQIKATLACIHYSRGDYDKAASGFQDIVDISHALLGKRNTNTLRAMHDRAVALIKAHDGNRLAEAEDSTREILKVCNEILVDEDSGKRHELSILAATTLSDVIMEGLRRLPECDSEGEFAASRRQEALDLLVDAAQESRESLGPLDPMALTAEVRLAATYAHIGDYEIAEVLYREVLAKQRQVLGPTHPTYIETLDRLLLLLDLKDDEEDRERVLSAALEGVDLAELGGDTDHPVLVGFRERWLPGS
ncbi:kinase-like domain-containing protein [Rhypophila decipiens]|uniref:Kinase-like domain-containing protein n=1 Tax=Rhypophila decipiens TaxID=261697 RepID=A0AAN6Y926_9PEZI|nr:kinase-like domain-containing protein [Rhypophila decipiens]